MIVNITGPDEIGRVPYQLMHPSDHEEADTRICVHRKDAMEKGARKVFVRTVDTDVIVIIAGIFFKLQRMYSDLDIWVAFGMGKNFQYYHMNAICQSLGEGKCTGLPFYHAFTGCDSFLAKGRSHPGGLGRRTLVLPQPFSMQLKIPFRY